jgi:DNA-directed RNA polymerase subunit L
MKHRIGLIPIYVNENTTDNYVDNDYVFTLNVHNTSTNTRNITTADFTGKYKDKDLTAKELSELFPKDNITKQNVLITRLRSDEKIELQATAIKRTAKTNASFSPVSLANFYFIEDKKESDKADNILDKQRSYIKNEYGDPTLIKFEIESVNNLSYKYLFTKALDILIGKLQLLIANIDTKTITIEPVPNNPFSFNFHIENEDDTLGNVIQSLMHNKYIRQNKKHKGIICNYVGYICPHPLKQLMILRLTLENQTESDIFFQFLTDNCYDIIRDLESIKTEWGKFNSKKK